MSHSVAGPDARTLASALLAHVEGKPVAGEVAESLGSLERVPGPERLIAAMHAAQIGEGAARAVGIRAATAGEVSLAARLAGIGSMERALRQADRLLPREHPDGAFTVRSLGEREGHIVYRAPVQVDPLLCAVRSGLFAGLPRCFGSPRARVTETECAAQGADACCYRVRWGGAAAERSGLPVLALGALMGTALGMGVWATGFWGPWASAALCTAIGVGAAAWLVFQSRRTHSDHRDELVAALEQRIAERMDDLAKLDSRLELRRSGGRPWMSSATPGPASIDFGALQGEVAAFGRLLESACQGGGDAEAAEDLEALTGPFAALRDAVDALVEEAGEDGAVDGREDLGNLLGSAVQRARRGRGGVPEIALDVPADLPFVHCAGPRIERALLLLLSHACANAGDGGQVEVAAREVAGGVEIMVCGRGAALDPDRVEEVFDPFLAAGAEPAPGGDELRGAARIVTDHGGALQLQSDAQSGVRASFVLPVADPS